VAARSYLTEQLGAAFADVADRYRLLAGRTPNNRQDPGAIVCACFEVGRNQIINAVASGRCRSVDAVGTATGAGTSCGSCRTEIGGLIHSTHVAKAG
jgi:assimilatory nitrate reductase catalytic subunit